MLHKISFTTELNFFSMKHAKPAEDGVFYLLIKESIPDGGSDAGEEFFTHAIGYYINGKWINAMRDTYLKPCTIPNEDISYWANIESVTKSHKIPHE